MVRSSVESKVRRRLDPANETIVQRVPVGFRRSRWVSLWLARGVVPGVLMTAGWSPRHTFSGTEQIDVRICLVTVRRLLLCCLQDGRCARLRPRGSLSPARAVLHVSAEQGFGVVPLGIPDPTICIRSRLYGSSRLSRCSSIGPVRRGPTSRWRMRRARRRRLPGRGHQAVLDPSPAVEWRDGVTASCEPGTGMAPRRERKGRHHHWRLGTQVPW